MRRYLSYVLVASASFAQSVWIVNGHTYAIVTAPGGVTWTQARALAVAAGGDLASPSTPAEDAFIKALLQPQHWNGYLGPWLGGTQAPGAAEPAGGWAWADGAPFSPFGWSADNNQIQPNNGGGTNEDRIHYLWQATPGWNDLPEGGEGGSTGPRPVAFVLEIPSASPVPFDLIATTAGNGVGDLTFGVVGYPFAASFVWIFISQTAAPAGLGTGAFLGLHFPDALLLTTLLQPPAPFDCIHFPIASHPFASGPLNLPAGTFSSLAGGTWELRALAYDVPTAFAALTPIHAIHW